MKDVIRDLPKTTEAYIAMVRDALFEIANMRDTLNYEEESTEGFEFLDVLEIQMKSLLAGLEAGTHEFGDDDLPCMAVIQNYTLMELPFRLLLECANPIPTTKWRSNICCSNCWKTTPTIWLVS